MVIISGIPYVISSTGLLYFFKKEVEQTPRVPTPVIPDFLSFSIFFFTSMKSKASSYGRVEHSKATPKENVSFPVSQVFIISPWTSVTTVLSQPKASNGVSSFNNLMPPEGQVSPACLQAHCRCSAGLIRGCSHRAVPTGLAASQAQTWTPRDSYLGLHLRPDNPEAPV